MPTLPTDKFGFGRIFSTKLTDNKALLACLSIGFLVRMVPELLAYSTPIGFDTISYAVVMKSGIIFPNWGTFFTSTWLLNAFIVPLYSLTQVDPFLILKIVGPLLYGLNVAGIYWFARKNLGWSTTMGIAAGIFFALQLATLRISWDLLRNTLGLGLLLFAFAYIKDIKSNRGLAIFGVLSVLSIFAHEYAAVTLIFVVLGLAVWRLVRGRTDLSKRLLLGVFPALSIFSADIYLRIIPIHFPSIASNIINSGDAVLAHPGRLFFLVNYLNVQTSVESYGSYSALAVSVGALFALLFLPYLYLVIKGFFKNRILTLWTGLLLVGAFSCLVTPFSAPEYWSRWMFMLAFPFTFYAIYGLKKLLGPVQRKGSSLITKLSSNRRITLMILLTFSLGIAYLASPIIIVYANASVPSVTRTYYYFSDSPSVPNQDVNDVIRAMGWLNGKMDSSSCVILHQSYQSWGELYLDNSHSIVTFQNKDVNAAVKTALVKNFSTVYFVWSNVPLGWYNVSVPNSFSDLQDFGSISVYVYGGQVVG